MAEMELFERFHEFSRAHEDWDLDEFALLILNLALALLVSTIYQSKQLKKLAKEREFEHQRAETNAKNDPLTGLPNRRAFSVELEKTAGQLSGTEHRFIAMIDLDRFKPVNDLQGHAVGDETLKGVAARLTEIFEDAVIARLGGDEFAVIFGHSYTAPQVEHSAQRVIQAIAQSFDIGGSQIFIGCSIGLARWEAGAQSDIVLSHADKALYLAKSQGRGQFAWYNAELDERSRTRAEIELDLRNAIGASEIKPWFQPYVDIASGHITGFEVLARWRNHERGPIPPNTFIEIAEDIGQIGQLGDSILRQAAISANQWDHALTLAVNISPIQFRDPNLVERISAILADCNFDPRRLTIEITESAIIHDFEVARDKVIALKNTGVTIALDDFGTGYSSLTSLRQIPFDGIKIDRSFVTDIANQPQNQKIVSGIMALANGLELNVTAEGIESRQDLDYLQSQEGLLGQGYFFEPAIPAEQVAWKLETEWADGVNLVGISEARSA